RGFGAGHDERTTVSGTQAAGLAEPTGRGDGPSEVRRKPMELYDYYLYLPAGTPRLLNLFDGDEARLRFLTERGHFHWGYYHLESGWKPPHKARCKGKRCGRCRRHAARRRFLGWAFVYSIDHRRPVRQERRPPGED